MYLRKTRPGKSRGYRDIIVYEELRFESVFRPPTSYPGPAPKQGKSPWERGCQTTRKPEVGVLKFLRSDGSVFVTD